MHGLAHLKELITRHADEGLTPTALPGVSVITSGMPGMVTRPRAGSSTSTIRYGLAVA